jgi:nitrite reductase/ring-hydroxylating ferredoxin subunit
VTRPVRVQPIGSDEILIEVEGRRLIAAAACPHRNGRLRFGRINARTMRITCPLHGATFDLLTGARVGGPDCGALRIERLDEHQEQVDDTG